MEKNKTGQYLKYAIGEIILVVIGILIALQISNWNEERKQAKELDGLMKSISSAIQSDIKYLKLIRTARENIGLSIDSIYTTYIDKTKTPFTFDDYAYIANTFDEIITPIYYQPNISSFEALKNSIYLSKLQGTDIELLLQTYYSSAERIQKQEEDYNQLLKSDYKSWSSKFRNKGRKLFLAPWDVKENLEKQERFSTILKDENTTLLLSKGFEERNMVSLYNQQIILGEKYMEMIDNQEMYFSEQTKIEFSSTLYSYESVDILNLLVNGKVPSDFELIYAQNSNHYFDGIEYNDDYVILTYPESTFDWGSPFFRIEVLNGRVTEMDFSKYKNLTIEMRGEQGGEEFALAMKDKDDLPDGTESRVNITVSKTWETYEVPIDQFETANKKIINTPLAFVFLGSEGVKIHVRSIYFN